VAVVMA
jgi:hypothetical protein